jgi:exosome complex RNA-binding protein Rrp4
VALTGSRAKLLSVLLDGLKSRSPRMQAAIKEAKPLTKGQGVTAEVLGVSAFYALCDIGSDSPAMLHLMDVYDEVPAADTGDILKVGDTIRARVKSIDTSQEIQVELTQRELDRPATSLEIGQEVTTKLSSLAAGGESCSVAGKNTLDIRARLRISDISDESYEDPHDTYADVPIVKPPFELNQVVQARIVSLPGDSGGALNGVALCDIGGEEKALLHMYDAWDFDEEKRVSSGYDDKMSLFEDMFEVGDVITTRVRAIDQTIVHLTMFNRSEQLPPLDKLEVGQNVMAKVLYTHIGFSLCDIGGGMVSILNKSNAAVSGGLEFDMRDTTWAGGTFQARVKAIDASSRLPIMITQKIDTKPVIAFEIGQEVEAKVLSIQAYGAFHDMGGSHELPQEITTSIYDVLKPGDTVDSVVKNTDAAHGPVRIASRKRQAHVYRTPSFVIEQELLG